MRQMVLRFFWYIWAAIIGTSLLVIVLAVSLGLRPPDQVPVETLAGTLQIAAREAFLDGGKPAVEALLSRDEQVADLFALVESQGADCAGDDRIGPVGATGCLRLQLLAPPFGSLRRFLPFLTPMTAGAGISLVIALMLARRFVRPIQRLGEALADLSKGDLDRRIGPALSHSEPAIADVGRAFDMAASKLQELTESRSRLFHDISHEIRSPLARLQVATALLHQNPARLEAMLPRIEADIARVDRLVEEILTLARLERGGLAVLQPVEIDLLEILDPMLRDAALEGQVRQVGLRYHGPDRLDLRCDPELLHRAFENILRNALRYSPQGGTVEVTVALQDGAVVVTFRDDGPGIDATQLTHIFHAFVRDQTGSGTGLGLAIAANAIRLHGGTVRAENLPGGGLKITATLPASGADRPQAG